MTSALNQPLPTPRHPRSWKTTPTGSDIPATVVPTCQNSPHNNGNGADYTDAAP
ncbi:hypothetical protein [Austwickia chelonae]|uniref:hypothetical protein n=1 Tax=Austwickia chelonae TaxID=100225 RepID=UPI0013C35281|nr:hypothetical protein [Austwickia chelonae]